MIRRAAVIGAGMSGILAAIRLEAAGIEFTVYEKASKVGGTWRDNTYPGIACDVPSHSYSYSFALNPDWSYFCSPGDEIQRYFERVADDWNVLPNIRFDDEVTSIEWDDGASAWNLTTTSGHCDTVDVVIAATGVLHHPKWPDIDGIDDFSGDVFHSARWDHDVTLDRRRVGVVGTGSTGVQITGELAGRASHLSLFQRTAQWVLPVEQVPYTAEQQRQFRTDSELLQSLHTSMLERFNDSFGSAIIDASSGITDRFEEQCIEELNKIGDPVLRQKMWPDYRAGCKRMVVSHNWYDAIQHPGVEIVTEPIAQVESAGVRTDDGRLHELDVLVLATGYHVDRFMRPISITGRDGRVLDDVWAERPTAHLAVAVPGFPNMFMLNGPNSPVGNFSLIQIAELQMGYIMSLIDAARSGVDGTVEVRGEAADRFDAERVEAARNTVWATGCRSWYLDDRGIPFAWPFTFERFRDEMTNVELDDYVVM